MSVASKAILIIFLVILAMELIYRNTEPRKLVSLIDQEDWDRFDKESSSWRAAFFMNPYRLFCIKLNS